MPVKEVSVNKKNVWEICIKWIDYFKLNDICSFVLRFLAAWKKKFCMKLCTDCDNTFPCKETIKVQLSIYCCCSLKAFKTQYKDLLSADKSDTIQIFECLIWVNWLSKKEPPPSQKHVCFLRSLTDVSQTVGPSRATPMSVSCSELNHCTNTSALQWFLQLDSCEPKPTPSVRLIRI